MIIALGIVALLFIVGAITLSCMSDGKPGREGAQLESAGCGLFCVAVLVIFVAVTLVGTGVIS